VQTKQLVVIGASAGGIETLRELVKLLPADFPTAIAVVLHTSPQSPGVLAEILERSGSLPVETARDMQRLQPGTIYVAPPDFHLLVEPGRLRLTKGPRENRFRPAIDPLFRSAAQVFGPAVIGVILTGNLDDGTAGLSTIKQLGGTAIVQDPQDAMFPSMPLSATRHVQVDHVVPLADIAPLLMRLTSAQPVATPAHQIPDMVDIEVKIAKEEDPVKAGVFRLGPPSPLACPECHGVLRELKEALTVRFRCHTGHAYSAESLLAEINESVETSLWNTIRAMQEGTLLMQRIAEHADQVHPATDNSKLAERAAELDRQSDVLRSMIGDATAIAHNES